MRKGSRSETGARCKQVICSSYKEFCSKENFTPSRYRIYCPAYILYEVLNHKAELIAKSKLPEDEFDILFESIFENIDVIPYEEIKPCYQRAKEIMENIDPDDAVFLALALCVLNDGIWTEDMHFDKQEVIRIWKTSELIDELDM